MTMIWSGGHLLYRCAKNITAATRISTVANIIIVRIEVAVAIGSTLVKMGAHPPINAYPERA